MEEEYVEIGNINVKPLKKFYNIKTKRLIITKERIEHMNFNTNKEKGNSGLGIVISYFSTNGYTI